jgi:hypothetical protein
MARANGSRKRFREDGFRDLGFGAGDPDAGPLMMPEGADGRDQGGYQRSLQDLGGAVAASAMDGVASIGIAEGFGNGTIISPYLRTHQSTVESAVDQESGPGLKTH